jgi:hypothetical protein
MIEVLEGELARCQRHLREIEIELRNLHRRPSVQLGMEVKLAQQRGQDLWGQMVADLEHKIARRTAERDLLKGQIDQLGPDQGVIQIG